MAESELTAPDLAGARWAGDLGLLPRVRDRLDRQVRRVPLPILILAITIAGGALRFATLGQGVWFDEAGAVRQVSGGLHDVWRSITHDDLTPPLYVVCLWLWRHLAGSGVFALRTLSALLGTATIPVAFLAANRLVGRRAAVTVALLTASSPVLLYYSQEIRAYALLVLLCSLGLLAFIAAWQAPSGRRLALWTVLSALALATHYFAALVVAPQAAALLVAAWRARANRLPATIAASVIGAEALALAVLLRYQNAHAYHYVLSVIRSPFVPEHFDASVAASGNGSNLGEELFLGPGGPWKVLTTEVMLVFGLPALINLSRERRSGGRGGARLALLMAAPAFAAAVIFQVIGQPYQGRYLLVVWLPLAIVIATGLSLTRNALMRNGAIITLCAVSTAAGVITATVPRYSGREDTAGPARSIGTASSTRLLAISQEWDLLPLRVYRPQARTVARPSAEVRELDVIAMPRRGFPADTDAVRPPPPQLSGLPRGMTLRQVIVGPTYVVERYESPRPVTLQLSPSAGVFSSGWRFLLEPGGGRLADP